MFEMITNLWNKNKFLFFIVIIPAIIIFGIKIFLQSNAEGGREDVIDAQNTDNDLKDQANDANDQANDHVAAAAAIEDEINKLKNK